MADNNSKPIMLTVLGAGAFIVLYDYAGYYIAIGHHYDVPGSCNFQ